MPLQTKQIAFEPHVRAAEPDDIPRIVELMKECLGEGLVPRNEAYWHWKHVDNPFGTSPVILAEVDDQLVGVRALMRWTWTWQGQKVTAVRAVDTATHADWRGRGIFSHLTLTLLDQLQDDGASFVFNTPNRYSMPGYLKMGWTSLGRASMWIRPVRPIRIARQLARRRHATDEHTDAFESVPVGSVIDELLAEPELDSFLYRCHDPHERLTTVRSAKYLDWRYARIPGFTYRAAWKVTPQGGAVFIYRRKMRGAITELRICEALVADGKNSIATARRMLNDIIRRNDADFVSAMAPRSSAAAAVFPRARFLPAPFSGPTLTIRTIRNNPHSTPDRSQLNLSIGDVEVF